MSSDPAAILADPGRLAALQGVGLLDGLAEEAFDRLTRLAARLADAPVALLTVVSAEDQVFKSVSAPTGEYQPGVATSLDQTLCRHTVAAGEPLIIEDARTHPLVQDDPAVSEHGVQAYLGFPLVTDGGYTLGTLCVLDRQPRDWSAEQIQGMEDLAAIAVAEIDLRRSTQREAAQILESITDAFVALDAQWQFTYLNQRAAQLLGRPAEEMIGRRIWEVFPSMLGGAGYRELHRAVREQRAVVYEERHLPLGTWFEVHAYPSGDGLSLFFQDVSEERQATIELEQTRERLTRTLETVADGLLIVGVDGRITFANPVAERTFGWSSHDIVGSAYDDPRWRPVAPDGVPLAPEQLPVTQVLSTGQPVYGSVHGIILPVGKRVILQVNAAPLADREGSVAGVVVSFSDITDRQRAAEREHLLAQASATLAGSLDYEVTLRQVVHLAVPALADLCIVDTLQPDGTLRLLVATGADPSKAGLLRALESHPRTPAPGGPFAEVLRSGRALLVPELSPEWLDRLSESPQHRRLIDRLGIKSAILAPLLARGDVLGLMSFGLTTAGQRYDADDLQTAEELARRAGAALDNARLYREAQEALRTTQRRATQLRGLTEAALAISSSRSVDAVLQVITEQAKALTGARHAVARVTAPGPENGPALEPPQEGGVLATALVGRDGRNIGLLELFEKHRGAFSDADEAILVQLARMASVAVENVRLFQESQAANRAKSDFLAVMSHELRTPLNAILGYSDLLVLGVPDVLSNGSARQVERIRAAAQHLLEVIEEILTFSRMEAGREEVYAERVDVGEIVGTAAEIIEPLARAKQLDLQVTLPESPVKATTDARKVRQILLNLLGNAVKFTETGEVRLAARVEDGQIVFEVHDTGIGISPEHAERVWEPFQQLESTMTRTVGGTGLGLTVSRQLARMLGGDVTMASTPGMGSTFTVRLPRVYLPSRNA